MPSIGRTLATSSCAPLRPPPSHAGFARAVASPCDPSPPLTPTCPPTHPPPVAAKSDLITDIKAKIANCKSAAKALDRAKMDDKVFFVPMKDGD